MTGATRSGGLVARIGGPAVMKEILRRFYQRLAADLIVGFHFAGRDLEPIIDGQLGFLRKAFGDATEFDGRHPGVAHTALAPILRGQFDRRLVLLEETLREVGLDDADREEWLTLERSMRRVVQGP